MSIKSGVEITMQMMIPQFEQAIYNSDADGEQLMQLANTIAAFEQKILPLYLQAVLEEVGGDHSQVSAENYAKIGVLVTKLKQFNQSIANQLQANSVRWLFANH